MALLAGVSAWGVLLMNQSPRLPGTHSDGVEYTTAAESLARDGSFTIPVTHWSDPDSTTVLSHYPPGFSLAIAAPMRVVGASTETALEWVMAAGAGLAVAVIFWVASAAGGPWAAWLAALLVICTPALAKLYVGVWSETLYLGVALLGVWALVAWPRRHLLHGILAAAGVAIRYVGIAGALAAMWFAWRRGGHFRDRALRVAQAGAPSAAVVLAWQAYVGTGSEDIRTVAVYPGVLSQSVEIVVFLARWLVPVNLARVIPVELALLLIPVGMTAVMWRGWPASEDGHRRVPDRARLVFVAFGLAYVAVVVLSRAFLDPLIPFDPRLFAPVLVLVTVGFAVCLANRLGRWSSAVTLGVGGVVAVWMACGLLDLHEVVTISSHEGRYYTHATWVTWNEDSAVEWAFRRSGDYPHIYSNEAAMVYLYGGRTAKHMVRREEDLAAFREAFRERPGPVLVTFPLKKVDLPPEAFVEALGLRLFRDTEYARLYLPEGSPELEGMMDGRP